MKLLLSLLSLSICGWVQGATIYHATLNGPSEAPPNASPGTGTAQVIYDGTAHSLQVKISFSGLTGTTVASHIHAPTDDPFTGTANVATVVPTFTGFPLGVTSGIYDHTFDLTLTDSFNPAFITANGGTAASAEAALIAAMDAGKAYVNIHTSTFRSGEIRGFLSVPEGGSVVLVWLTSLLGLFGVARRWSVGAA